VKWAEGEIMPLPLKNKIRMLVALFVIVLIGGFAWLAYSSRDMGNAEIGKPPIDNYNQALGLPTSTLTTKVYLSEISDAEKHKIFDPCQEAAGGSDSISDETFECITDALFAAGYDIDQQRYHDDTSGFLDYWYILR
jgi:hypothetical protein